MRRAGCIVLGVLRSETGEELPLGMHHAEAMRAPPVVGYLLRLAENVPIGGYGSDLLLLEYFKSGQRSRERASKGTEGSAAKMIPGLPQVGGPELIILLFIILLLFGAKRVPNLARSLGSGLGEFRKSASGHHDETGEIDNAKSSKQGEDAAAAGSER